MRRAALVLASAVALASCDGREDKGPTPGNAAEAASTPERPAADPPAAAAPDESAGAQWDLQSSGEGTALALLSAAGGTALRLFCPADGGTLLVNVPGFRPVGSEERLSFGSGGQVEALVADTKGDKARGGVSATGAVPAQLAGMLRDRVSASYGAQTSGPHPAPPGELARAFASACRPSAAAAAAAAAPAHPCAMQDGQRLDLPPRRAIGTEPFWGARTQGRCVTYSHPEDQAGTRVWTRYAAAPNGGGSWAGALGGKPFALTVRKAPGCSDGMSDRRYPMAAELVVGGEKRRGCAE